MKKQFKFMVAISAILVLLVSFACTVSAEEVASGTYGVDVTWSLDDNGTLTISGSGAVTETNSSEKPWTSYRKEITKIVVEGEIENIPTLAFWNEINVTEVVLSDSIQIIGTSAFENCSSLTKITLPKNLKQIGVGAFEGCKSLSEVAIGDAVTEIKTAAFRDCTSLVDIVIPDSVTVIEQNIFSGCTSLKTVTLSKNLSDAGKNIVPAGVTVYGYENSMAQLVAQCCGAEFVSIGVRESVVLHSGSVTDTVEWELNDIGVLTIKGEGKMIDYVDETKTPWYEHREKILAVQFEEGITHISSYGFKLHTDILSLVIPGHIESVGAHAFEYCNTPTLTIEDGVKRIDAYAFCDMPISEIVIPDSVTEIDVSAFENCWLLEKATLSAGLKNIPSKLFYSCELLATVIFKEGNQSIGSKAFSGVGLTTVTLPESVTEIGESAFSENKKMTSAIINGPITSVGAGAFSGCNSMLICTFRKSAVEIGEGAFQGCSKLTYFSLSDGIKTIGEDAFLSCTSLNNVTIGNTVGYIAPTAFDKCSSSLTIKSNPGSVGEYFANKYGYTFSKTGKAQEIVIAQGKMNDTVNWSISTGGILTLSGVGETSEYDSKYTNQTPWKYYDSYITKLVVEEGITHLYDWQIGFHKNIEKVYIDNSVIYISSQALPAGFNLKIYADKYSIGEYMAKKNEHSFYSQGTMPECVIRTGTCGDASWSLDSRGVLTFTGTGEIDAADFTWEYYSNYVTKIVVTEGITSITLLNAPKHENLTELDVHYSVLYIKDESYVNPITVTGYKYSIGEYFAKNNGFFFVSVGEMPQMEIASGSLSEDDYWSIDSRGNMIFTGSKVAAGYSSNKDIPWAYYAEYVTSLTVEEGITYLNNWAASAHTNLETIQVHYSVVGIRNGFDYLKSKPVIKGYSGSRTQVYAEECDLEFVSIGQTPDEIAVSGNMDGFEWSISTLGHLIITGEGEMPTYNGLLSYPWYIYSEDLTELTLGNDITLVPDAAFIYYNYSFKKVTIPCYVNSFRTDIFAKDAVIVGYEYSFAEELALKYGYEFISIGVKPEEVIDAGTFGDSITWSYTNHRNLTIDGSGYMPTYIPIPWRDYLDNMEGVEITGTIASIAPEAFRNSNITSIEIPLSVTGIADRAFANCDYLVKITIPDTVLAIADTAFYSCDSLEEITLPSYLILANFSMIDGCTGLKTIYGRDDTFAQRLAEGYHKKFVSTGETPERVYMVTNITDTIHYEIDNLGDMTVVGEGEIPDFVKYDGYLTDNTDTLIINGTITRIGDFAFSGLKSIKNIELEEGITEIGESAFSYAGVKEIKLPSTVTTIGAFAFANCGEMEYMWLNDNVEVIPRGLFRFCESLKAVEIPASVKSIEANVFDYVTEPVYLHYAASQEQWNAIPLAENLPENVIVVYNSHLPEEVYVEVSRVTKSTKGANITVNSRLRGDEAAFIAGYDEEGTLVDIVRLIPHVINYSIEGDISTVKVFFWDGNTTLVPINNVYEEKIN